MKIQNILPLIFLLTALNMAAQDYTEINREELLELTGKVNDTTYVINFWATWCSPCVKEIVFFEDLHRENPGEETESNSHQPGFPQAGSDATSTLSQREIHYGTSIANDQYGLQ